MKRSILLSLLALGLATAAVAQNRYQMTVQQKNGATYLFDVNQIQEVTFTEIPFTDEEIAWFENALEDTFFHLRGTFGRRYMEAQTLSSDEMVGISFDGDYYDAGTYAHTCLHNFSNTDPCTGWYSDVLIGISRINGLLTDYAFIDLGKQAQARALRAFYHWILMDSFGDAPILDHVLQEGEATERQRRSEVAYWIERELLDVLPMLPAAVDETTYGKPTRWMAEALLVKLYINWAVYTASDVTQYDAASSVNPKLNNVVSYCDDIIRSGLFSLGGGANGYRSKFYPNNGPQIADFIYAMPYDTQTQQGMQYMRPCIWRQGRNDGNGGPSYFGMELSLSVGGNFSMTPQMADLFTLSGDARNGCIIGGQIYLHDPQTYEPTTTPWTYQGEPVVLSKNIELTEQSEQLNVGRNVKGWSQGYKSLKYYVINDDFKNGRNLSNDVPIFRYADILLMKAEAIVRGAMPTNDETAMSLFNKVRAYAGAPLIDHEPSLQELLDERGREFFHENWRRNDMIRFGTFENEYGLHLKNMPTARFDKECRLFPIPQGVLEENTNWKQNAGY